MNANSIPVSRQYLRETARAFVYKGGGREISIIGSCRLPLAWDFHVGLQFEIEQDDRSYQFFTLNAINFVDGSSCWAVSISDKQTGDMLPHFVGNH